MKLDKIKCVISRLIGLEHICRDCIKDGMVIYCVTSLGKKSYMDKHTIIGTLHKSSLSWFAETKVDDYESRFSLMDYGIVPNCYNTHKAFIKEENANNYLKQCIGED